MERQKNIKDIFKHRYPFELKEEGMDNDAINKKQMLFHQEYETKKRKKKKKKNK